MWRDDSSGDSGADTVTPDDGDASAKADSTKAKADSTEAAFHVASVRRLLKRGATSHLENLLAHLRPADAARVVGQLKTPVDRRTVFDLIGDAAEQGRVASELSGSMIVELLQGRSADTVAEMLRAAPADDAAYILSVLPETVAQDVLPMLRADESREVAHLMGYPGGTAGGMMTTQFFSLSEHLTVGEAMKRLQGETRAETVFYVYTTNHEGRLTGVISLRELLAHTPETPLAGLLHRNVIAVGVHADHQDVADQVAKYNLLAIPVVDDVRRLLGIITVDDVVDVIRDESTKAMLTATGTAKDDNPVAVSSLRAAKIRFPWLFTNLAGSLMSGWILWWFRFTIHEVVAIVTFVPVIAAMGGNLGLQSSTLIIRGLATGRIVPGHIRGAIFRELRIGLLLGTVCGVLLFLVGWGWQGNGSLGMVVGGSLLITFILSASIATVTPFLLKRLGVDPAVAAGPFITTIMDVMGVSIYLGMATAMLESLR